MNIYGLIGNKDQRKEKKYRNACAIFSFTHNLEYNTGISMDYIDIEEIMKEAQNQKLFDENNGGYTKVFEIGFEIAQEKTKDKLPKYKLIKCKYGDKKFWELINLGYAVRVGFASNKDFTKDRIDGNIDTYADYINYKGKEVMHFFNVALNKQNNGLLEKEIAIDSFSPHFYTLDIKEFGDVAYPTCYAVKPILI